METLHTPGPWTCQPIGDETECNILGKGRELIATVADCDAPLIASAPEMAEVLQLVAHAYANPDDRMAALTAVMPRVAAVLAKAGAFNV